MSRSEGVIWCDNCGVEITWSPIVSSGLGRKKEVFCCEDCYFEYRCHCGERMELEDDRRRSRLNLFELN